MNVLVTGSAGFIGRNLVAWLRSIPEMSVLEFDRENDLADLDVLLAKADLVYHLAGVNRPQSDDEFESGNVELTSELSERLLRLGRPVPVVFSSSIQAELDNPYGASKRRAEGVLAEYAAGAGVPVIVFRLSNVFGKWARPNYNSVVATFCHNVARGLPITISDPDRELPLVHVDDVVKAFLEAGRSVVQQQRPTNPPMDGDEALPIREAEPIKQVTLGRLADLVVSFRQSRESLVLPDLDDPFVRKLYGTYLSYLEPGQFSYRLASRSDARGVLVEFVKSDSSGQIFVSRTKPRVTRGNHYHHTKAEKFLVVEGSAIVRFRQIGGAEVIEYPVSGDEFSVVDIPPGYTHSIENVGGGELVTVFWASEVFDPAQPDTIYEEV